MNSRLNDRGKDLPPAPVPQSQGDRPRRIGDIWQWLGMSGDAIGTSGVLRRTFLYSHAVAMVITAAVNTLNVISILHDMPHLPWIEPVIWEGASWLTLVLFLWIPWIAYRLAPPFVRPRWRLLVHVPALLLYSMLHVGGFLLLRTLAYRAMGEIYADGGFWDRFGYELTKDALGYALFMAGFALMEHLLRQQTLIEAPGQSLTFDIRDGNRLTRVQLSQILAITAAGNYVEFALEDGRKFLMRSSLSGVENDLAPRGFLRTHRSWLINTARVTELSPDGSGDYTVSLDAMKAPLSRRFPEALERLRKT